MYKLLIFIVCCFAYPSYVQAQDLYIHTDRDQYQNADTLWFKVYAFDPQTLSAAPVQTIYVQLVSEDKKVICVRTLLLANGSTQNHIPLDSLKGQYQLIAYTKAQLRQKDMLFRKNIFVSENVSQSTHYQIDSSKIDVQFLPEGGHLVAELPTIVAFKANDANGGVEVEGDVLNEANEEITHFKSNFRGTGRLSFVPKNNQKYRAKVIIGGKTHLFELPKLETNGVVMRVIHQEKDSVVTVRVYQSGQSFRRLKLEVLSRGRLYIAQNLTPKNLSIVKIMKSALPLGIAQLRVLADTSVLLERLLCVNRVQGIDLQVTSNTTDHQPNEKIELNIVASHNGTPIETELSLSITDAAQPDGFDPKTSLFSHLYLQSEVRGYVSEPAYYFDTTQAESYQNLDLLLLTQGWRKYRWNNKFLQNTLEAAPPIEGLITKYGINKPSEGVTLTYSYPNHIDQVKTNVRGYFKIENHRVHQDNQVYFQARKKYQDLYSIAIISPKTESLYQKLPTQAVLQNKMLLKNSPSQTNNIPDLPVAKTQQLKEVVIKDKSTQKKAVQQMMQEIGLGIEIK